jgi:hypothetical protein
MIYQMKGVHAKISVSWKFQAAEGAQDTHFSLFRGSWAHVIIRQGKEQKYRPEVYVEPAPGVDEQEVARALLKAIAGLQKQYPGLALIPENNRWHIRIPEVLRLGHEAHFREVMHRYIKYLEEGKLPPWEAPNMLAKYYLTTEALARAEEVKEK